MSEQQPPVEHWRGRLDVPRPAEPPRRGRRFYAIIATSFVVGLLALGGLALWSQLASSPNVFSWGAGIIFLVCLIFAVLFIAPLPLGINPAPGPSLYSGQPLPLVTTTLAFVAFGLPSFAALVALTVSALRVG